MVHYTGRILEIQLEIYKKSGALIECPNKAVPSPGQYLLAHCLEETDKPFADVLFPAGLANEQKDEGMAQFLTAPGIPENWSPGTTLQLSGPLGKGFRLPERLHRLALVALAETAARLLLLAYLGLTQGAEVALFTDLPLPQLPSDVEALPLKSLSESRAWADFMAIDLFLEDLRNLRARLGLHGGESLSCPTQALVVTPMPCGGMGECAVCAVPTRRGKWKLACKDGPVFELNDLDW
jgi:NAD(P)H-flavin reductase